MFLVALAIDVIALDRSRAQGKRAVFISTAKTNFRLNAAVLDWLQVDANRALSGHSCGFDFDEVELNRTVLKRSADDELFVRAQSVDHGHRLDLRSAVGQDLNIAISGRKASRRWRDQWQRGRMQLRFCV